MTDKFKVNPSTKDEIMSQMAEFSREQAELIKELKNKLKSYDSIVQTISSQDKVLETQAQRIKEYFKS